MIQSNYNNTKHNNSEDIQGKKKEKKRMKIKLHQIL